MSFPHREKCCFGFPLLRKYNQLVEQMFIGGVVDNNLGYLERAITVGIHPLLSQYTENTLFKLAIEYKK